jgi:hypothetical protein
MSGDSHCAGCAGSLTASLAGSRFGSKSLAPVSQDKIQLGTSWITNSKSGSGCGRCSAAVLDFVSKVYGLLRICKNSRIVG